MPMIHLPPCPRTGEGRGVHHWLFRAAGILQFHFSDEDKICEILAEGAVDCGREVKEREIREAIRDSNPSRPRVRTPPWPAVDWELRNRIVREGPALADLFELSPVRLQADRSHAKELLDAMFPSGCLLCVGRADNDFDTLPREHWRLVIARRQLIVPSPMSSVTGLTKCGHVSKHSEANTGDRRYLIVEFDKGEFNEHAALHWHLAQYAPLVAVVSSAGKSLHGWYACRGVPEDKARRFFNYAVTLGADPKLWSKCQFTRVPDGFRPGAKRPVDVALPNGVRLSSGRQSTLYFNPSLIPA